MSTKKTPKGAIEAILEPFRHLIGVEVDRVVAARAGVSLSAVSKYRRKIGVAAVGVKPSKLKRSRLLGKIPDREVAERVGLSAAAVRNYRRARGIRASRPPGDWRRDVPDGPVTSLVALFHDKVGTVPDSHVARLAGVVVGTVAAYRRRHGIPAFGVYDPDQRRFAWRITLQVGGDELVRYTVAADPAVACRLAGAVGEVVALERLGDAL